jgi:hypothetical protein
VECLALGEQMGNNKAFEEIALDHAWRYFELHSKQRIAIFNFFIVASGAAFAGIGVTLQQGATFSIVGIAVGLLLALTAFLFWKLDSRASALIKHAEGALSRLEENLPETGRLFAREATGTGKAEAGKWTFGRVFRFTFASVGMAGLIGAALSLASCLHWVSLLSGPAAQTAPTVARITPPTVPPKQRP